MRLVSVSGTRGSGKTTLVTALIRRLSRNGATSALIVNEEGDAKYEDALTLGDGGIPVERIRGG